MKSDKHYEQVQGLSAEKLALLVMKLKQKASAEIIPRLSRVAGSSVFPVSFAQRRIWLADQLESGNPIYNLSGGLRLVGKLNLPALHSALDEIIRRHEVLRTTFSLREEEPAQEIRP